MNICHLFSTFLPTTSGGVEKHILTLSEAMVARGNLVKVLLPRRDSLPNSERIANLEIVRLGSGLSTKFSSMRLIGSLADLFSNNVDFLLRSWGWLHSDNNAAEIDLIHAHTDGIGLLGYSVRNANYISKWTKKPLVLSLHQKIGKVLGDVPPSLKLFKKSLDISDQVVVYRRVNLRYLHEWGYGHKTNFVQIPIDVKSFQRPSDLRKPTGKLRILSVGRLDHRRGILPLIEAYRSAQIINPEIELHVVGYGVLENQARELVKKWALKGVFFYGKQIEVRKYLWSSDIYVSLNISDNYPSLALREAMAAGLVPIVTDVGETREIVTHGANGLLVRLGDKNRISDAIITLANDRKLRQQLSANAQLSSKSFDVEHQGELFFRIYENAINR